MTISEKVSCRCEQLLLFGIMIMFFICKFILTLFLPTHALDIGVPGFKRFVDFKIKHNYRISLNNQHSTFLVNNLKSIEECIAECTSQIGCEAGNFNLLSQICELFLVSDIDTEVDINTVEEDGVTCFHLKYFFRVSGKFF